MIRAILFDLGDTLLDFEPWDTRAVFRESARITWHYLASAGATVPSLGRYTRSINRSMRWSYLWSKLTGREFNLFDLLLKCHRRFSLPCDAELMRELCWLWYEPITHHTRLESDLANTLSLLRAAGLKLAVVSNTFVPGFVHDRHLELLGIAHHFDARIYSSDVGYRKPDRRIFMDACSRLSVAPSQAMFVGDLVKTDVVGASRLGMKTALKQPHSNPRPHPLADYLICRVADLLEILEIARPKRNAEPEFKGMKDQGKEDE